LSALFFVTSRLFDTISFLECIFVSIPLSMILISWASLACAFVLGGLSKTVIWIVTLFFAATIPHLYSKCKIRMKGRNFMAVLVDECLKDSSVTLYMIVMSVIMAHFASTHFLRVSSHGGWYSSGSTWGDLPFHLNLVSSFVLGRNSSIRFGFFESPFFAGAKLIYPILPDYHSALLVAGGWSLRQAFAYPCWGLLVSYVGLLYFFTYRFTGSGMGGMIAPILSIASGGMAWYHDDFWNEWRRSNARLGDFLARKGDNYAHYQRSGESLWFQTLTDMLLPQRSALLAYPMCMSAMTLIWISLTSYTTITEKSKAPIKHDRIGYQLNLVAGILVGLLPYAQGHAYIAMAVLASTAALFHMPWKRQLIVPYIIQWAFFVVPSVGLGMPQLAMLSKQAQRWGFVRFTPMWVEPQLGRNIFHAWYRSLGISVPLCLIGGLVVLERKHWRYWASSWLVFLVGAYCQFQPWKLDNCKVFQVWHWTVCSVIGAFLGYLWTGQTPSAKPPPALSFSEPSPPNKKQRSYTGKVIRVVVVASLLFLLTASGMLCLIKENNLNWELFNRYDRELADYAKKNTEPEAVFLTSDQHNCPVITLAGRHTLVGYKGWLDSHGYAWQTRSNDVNRMYSGDSSSLDLLTSYNVNYIIIGDEERRENRANEDFFRTRKDKFEVMFKNQAYTLYKMK